mmetsp:Transcript_29437/g.59361  ORF Transcript_29437/g.59361 Transcript_29437/m.59361 type:complete len:140 (-) Transcript_29437:36-455(-)
MHLMSKPIEAFDDIISHRKTVLKLRTNLLLQFVNLLLVELFRIWLSTLFLFICLSTRRASKEAGKCERNERCENPHSQQSTANWSMKCGRSGNMEDKRRHIDNFARWTRSAAPFMLFGPACTSAFMRPCKRWCGQHADA